MKLGEKQELFVLLLPSLLLFAVEIGKQKEFTVRPGELWRPGDRRCHGMKIAIDLNFIDVETGKLIKETEAHLKVGGFWESLHSLARWGGRFGDGNHYSLTHNGIK